MNSPGDLMLHLRVNGQSTFLQPGQRLSTTIPTATYRDTPASRLERLIDRIRAGAPWRDAVRDEYGQNQPWLCDIVTHPSRSRFFDDYPLAPGAWVLDVGAGWGQISLPLAREHQVVALEPTPERLEFIMAAADQEGVRDRSYFVQASMLDVEFEPVFDCVCCIGVLEWTPKFAVGDPAGIQLEFLRRLRGCLRPGGACVIGIENRLGLKYLLGAPDDHIGLPGIALLDPTSAQAAYRARTGEDLRCLIHSLVEYRALLAASGFTKVEAFAAFPDYKLPQRILPVDESFNARVLAAPFIREHDGSTGQTLPEELQNALASHYRSLAASGVAQVFAPSYFLRAS